MLAARSPKIVGYWAKKGVETSVSRVFLIICLSSVAEIFFGFRFFGGGGVSVWLFWVLFWGGEIVSFVVANDECVQKMLAAHA